MAKKGTPDKEQLFEDRIDDQVDLDDPALRGTLTPEEFKQEILSNFLTKESNNPDWFWEQIEASNKLQNYLEENISNYEAVRLNDEAKRVYKEKKAVIHSVREGSKTRNLGLTETYDQFDLRTRRFLKGHIYWYKEEVKTGQIRYRDLNSGRFIKRPEGKGKIIRPRS